MKAAILCRGNSILRTYPGADGYDVVVAVNGTAQAYPATHWVFVDPPTFHKHVPIGFPTLFLHQGMKQILGRAGSEWYSPNFSQYKRSFFQDVELTLPDSVAWMNWSQEASMVLCWNLGVTQIDVFGADWQDAPTFDGKKFKSDDHSESRWVKERIVWDQVNAYIGDRGVKINRVI